MAENPCCNCSEVYRKRPRCKSLKCPMYYEHLKEDEIFEKAVKEGYFKKKVDELKEKGEL